MQKYLRFVYGKKALDNGTGWGLDVVQKIYTNKYVAYTFIDVYFYESDSVIFLVIRTR